MKTLEFPPITNIGAPISPSHAVQYAMIALVVRPHTTGASLFAAEGLALKSLQTKIKSDIVLLIFLGNDPLETLIT